jgi:S-adenosylmethionine hydrolase
MGRYPILLVTPQGSFIGPDYGIFHYVLTAYGSTLGEPLPPNVRILDAVQADVPSTCQVFILDRSEYGAEAVSDTFHGRDIFAPIAGHLANGVPASELGSPIALLNVLYLPYPKARSAQIEGSSIHIDRFGNLVTNLVLEEPIDMSSHVEINGHRITRISRNYQSSDGLLALKGSHGFLEIKYRNNNASEENGALVVTKVVVLFNLSDG